MNMILVLNGLRNEVHKMQYWFLLGIIEIVYVFERNAHGQLLSFLMILTECLVNSSIQ